MRKRRVCTRVNVVQPETSELAFRRQLDQLLRRGLKEKDGGRIRDGVTLLLQPAGPQEKVRDLAEEHRLKVEAFFKGRDFTNIVVPKLALSNTQLNNLRNDGKEPEYRPSDAEVPYDAFMKAVGQGNHWTVTHDDRHKIGWASCAVGYWFIAYVQPSCPRTGTSWEDLTKTTSLLSLEEYMITWWERKSKGIVLDVPTWCWLRTRFGASGALRASGYDGVVDVDGNGADDLARSFGDAGGRATEVMKKPAA